MLKSPLINTAFSPYNYFSRNPKRKIGRAVHNKINFDKRFFSPHQNIRNKKKNIAIKEMNQNMYKIIHSKIDFDKSSFNFIDKEININKTFT